MKMAKGDDTTCPTCGRDDFSCVQGMRSHHTMVHGETLTLITIECSQCGVAYEAKEANAKRYSDHFCSNECMSGWMEGRPTGNYKLGAEYRDEEHLHKLYHDDGKSLTEIADEAGVAPQTIHSWMIRLDIPRRSVEEGDGHLQHSKVEVTCSNCGTELTRVPSRMDRNERHFCSGSCHMEWRSKHWTGSDNPLFNRVTVSCTWCDNSFEVLPRDLRKQERFFCSDDCHFSWRSEFLSGENHPRFSGGRAKYGVGWNESKKKTVRERDGHECQVCGMGQENHLEKYGCCLHVHHLIPARQFNDDAARNAMSNLVSLCYRCHRRAEQMAPLLPQEIAV